MPFHLYLKYGLVLYVANAKFILLLSHYTSWTHVLTWSYMYIILNLFFSI